MEKVSLFESSRQTHNALGLAAFAVFDLETTGLSHKDDDILEIAVQAIRLGEIEKEVFHTLIKTEKQISPRITAINHITNAMVVNAPNVHDVLNEVFVRYNNCIFVAHNAWKFDARFLVHRSNLFQSVKFLDTKVLAQSVLPGIDPQYQDDGHSTGFSQAALCRLFGIEIRNQHTAKGDIESLQTLFRKLVGLLDNPTDLFKFVKPGNEILK